jgi:hypothetical protein
VTRTPRRIVERAIAATIGLAMAESCARETAQGAVEYFPIEVGAHWIYQVAEKGVVRGRLSVNVTDRSEGPDGSTYSLKYEDSSHSGEEQDDEPIEYTTKQTGVYCEKCPGFILRDPLLVGRQWQSGGDSAQPELSRVIAIGNTVTLGGTRYQNCVVVVASDPVAHQQVVTTYAPHVGPILAEYQNDRGVVERREELVSFQLVSRRRPPS